MKSSLRGTVALFSAVVMLCSAAFAQDRTVLSTEREKISYTVGSDIGQSIMPVGPDLDLASFEKAIRNTFAGGQPLLAPEDAKATYQALLANVSARNGQPPADGKVPPVSREKVGLLVGTDVGRSLASIKDEIELPILLQAVRTTLAKQTPLLSADELNAVRQGFQARLQKEGAAKAAAVAEKNTADGAQFLAGNKQVKGVFTTTTGLQYMVLRQGNGPRPKTTDRVRVNYEGKLLDGKVFDSSYARGQPVDFPLNQVIPGWTEGVSLMPVGAKYRFWIPGPLAYGERGTPDGTIGPNATLTFDVELLSINP